MWPLVTKALSHGEMHPLWGEVLKIISYRVRV
jgi:hypothetical protein